MKDVMISIRPKWCELIANGEKTIEVRKTRPKINTPFKCLIYCTKIKDKKRYSDEFDIPTNTRKWLGNGKVIGEFVCDDIDNIFVHNDVVYCVSNTQPNKLKQMCLSVEELKDYLVVNPNIASTLNAVDTNTGYTWHISKLKIYDEPKELSEFSMYGFKHLLDSSYCSNCSCKFYIPSNNYIPPACKKNGNCVITRPPQSWCYCARLEESKNE